MAVPTFIFDCIVLTCETDFHNGWYKTVLEAAKRASTHPNQILFLVLTTEAERLLHLPADFAQLQQPAAPAGNAANGVISFYKIDHDDYRTLQIQTQAFQTWLSNHISPDIKLYLESNVDGINFFHNLTITEIMTHLKNEFGATPSTYVFEQMKAILETKFHEGMEIKDHINSFNRVYQFYKLNGRTAHEHEKYLTLKQSMASCPDFYNAILAHEITKNTPALQRYSELCTLLNKHREGMRTIAAAAILTSSAHTAAATAKPASGPRNGNNRTNRNNSRTNTKFDPNLEAPNNYCWTHGHCFHSVQHRL